MLTLNKTLLSMQGTSDQAQQILLTVGPSLNETLGAAQRAMARIETTMQSADVAVAQVAEITAPGAPIRADLEQSLRDLSASVESLRHFADTVERQPNAVIFGKD